MRHFLDVVPASLSLFLFSSEAVNIWFYSAFYIVHVTFPLLPSYYSYSSIVSQSLFSYYFSLHLWLPHSHFLFSSLFLSPTSYHSFSFSLLTSLSLSLHTDPSDEMEVESLFFHSTPSKQNSRSPGRAIYVCTLCHDTAQHRSALCGVLFVSQQSAGQFLTLDVWRGIT